jgi:drug/metabolite transporter (DMT)-like permease
MNLALEHVAAGRSAVLSYTTPLWIVPASLLILGESISACKTAGLATGLLGMVVLFNPFAFDWSSREALIGNGLLMLAALTWAIAILVARTHEWTTSPLQLSPWQMLLAALVLAPAAMALESFGSTQWSVELTAAMTFNGLVATGFCFWGALVVARELPVVTTSIGFLGVPVAGVITSAIALGEPLTRTLAIGLSLIIAGIVMITLADRHRRHPACCSGTLEHLIRFDAWRRALFGSDGAPTRRRGLVLQLGSRRRLELEQHAGGWSASREHALSEPQCVRTICRPSLSWYRRR